MSTHGEEKKCLGTNIAKGTFRFLGSMVQDVCEGVYVIAPFIRPKAEKRSSPAAVLKPVFIPKPRREEEAVHVPKPIVSHKHEPEPPKTNPFAAIFEAMKPTPREKVEEKPVPHVEKRPEPKPAKPIEVDTLLKGMAFHDPDEAIRAEVYMKDFNSGTPRMRREALAQIETLPRPLAVEILRRLMEGRKDALIQMELLDVLSGLNHDGTLDKRLFKEYLKNENAILRLAAVRAFSKYKDEESFEILSSAMSDGDPEIRKRALSSVLTSFEKRAVPLALRTLTDSDAQVRKTAVSICGILRAKQAISVLISILEDPEKEVQKTANESLKKITGQDFDFNANGSQVSKKGAVEAWRFWWRNHQSNFGSQTTAKTKATVAAVVPVKTSKLVLGQL